MAHQQAFPIKIIQLNIENTLQPELDYCLITCTCRDQKILEYIRQKVLIYLFFLLWILAHYTSSQQKLMS